MARQERYTIGPNLLRDIRSTIQKVDALAPHTSGPTQGVRYWDMQRPMAARTDVFKICTFTGTWSIGGSKTVTFKYQTNTPNTVVVTNLFVPLESAPDGPADCAIAKEGTAWFLVNADHAASQIIVGTVFESWPVNASATVTQNNPDGTEMLDAPTFTVKNYIANLVLNGDSMRVICALVDDVWVLLAWDWTALENWSSSETQALGHTPGGGLKWINVAAC